jgi:glycine betaine catabolism A
MTELRAPAGIHEDTGPPRERFVTQGWHERELAAVFRPMWHLVCHATELPEAGSYMTFSLGAEQVFVIRARDGAVHAYHNFCRHRGHRLCTADQGKFRRLIICPYHSWSYSPENGSCHHAVKMHEGFNPDDWPLLPVAVEEVDGLVFVCMDENPPASIGQALRDVGFGGYDMTRLKLAARRSYAVEANWKIVVENNSECYHCAANHPELCTVYDPWGIDFVEHPDELDGSHSVATVTGSDAAGRSLAGMSWTIDGEVVNDVPMPRTDGGPADGRELWWHPGNFAALARDMAFIFTLRPLGPQQTLKTDLYLVSEDAREGIDYDLEKLTRFWQTTMKQDVALCEEVQRGMSMPGYTPGPLNKHYQAGQIGFYRWYEERLRNAPTALTAP